MALALPKRRLFACPRNGCEKKNEESEHNIRKVKRKYGRIPC